jgi:hypothetical protein
MTRGEEKYLGTFCEMPVGTPGRELSFVALGWFYKLK